jgi:Fibronectin type III domain
MRQAIRILLTVLVLSLGFAAAPGPASAATAVPWAFVQVRVSGTNIGSDYVPLTAYCPSGFTPVSGGISGPGPYTVINEYATYWNNSFSEQVFSFISNVRYVLTAECAEADQVGGIQVIGADFGRNSSGRAGGWVACPTGTLAIGGGADWNMASTREIDYSSPTDDDGGWYAAGYSDTAGDSLHVETYCVDSGELAGAQLVTQAYTDPPSGTSLVAACPANTRTLSGGVYATLAGSGVNPGVFAGQMQDSFPDVNRLAWHASVPAYMPTGTTVYLTAWCVPASIPAVVITSGPPAVTAQTFAHLSFTGSDPAGYQLTYSCDLDGTVSGCDSSTGTGYDPVSEGAHYFIVSVRNADGEQDSASYHWTVDTTAPTVTATAPSQPFTLASSATVSWTGQDSTGGTGLAYFQVRERTAAYSSGFTPWTHPSTWQALNPATTSVTASGLAQGGDYCFAVRAVDNAGNTSPWTTPRCTARPLDDRALSVGAGWARGTGSSYWNGTITTTSTHAATARRTGAELDRAGIVATRGPGMGTIAVYVGAKQIGQISLAAASTTYQNLILLPRFSYSTATVAVKVVSSGKPVQLDGLAMSRS